MCSEVVHWGCEKAPRLVFGQTKLGYKSCVLPVITYYSIILSNQVTSGTLLEHA